MPGPVDSRRPGDLRDSLGNGLVPDASPDLLDEVGLSLDILAVAGYLDLGVVSPGFDLELESSERPLNCARLDLDPQKQRCS